MDGLPLEDWLLNWYHEIWKKEKEQDIGMMTYFLLFKFLDS